MSRSLSGSDRQATEAKPRFFVSKQAEASKPLLGPWLAVPVMCLALTGCDSGEESGSSENSDPEAQIETPEETLSGGDGGTGGSDDSDPAPALAGKQGGGGSGGTPEDPPADDPGLQIEATLAEREQANTFHTIQPATLTSPPVVQVITENPPTTGGGQGTGTRCV